MGWGCYKHEMDAGSDSWAAAVSKLCDRKLAEHPRTFGRNNEVCPLCYEELERALAAEKARADEAEATATQRLKEMLAAREALARDEELLTQALRAVDVAERVVNENRADKALLAESRALHDAATAPGARDHAVAVAARACVDETSRKKNIAEAGKWTLVSADKWRALLAAVEANGGNTNAGV